MIKPINAESLKDLFVRQFEENILSGYFSPGERLPSERDLAARMNVSRPVVHEGLVDLAAKGLVTMRPRHGTIVNDYRKEGSLALLISMLHFGNETITEELLTSVLAMRMLFEVENARLAALHRDTGHVQELFRIIRAETSVKPDETDTITHLDFDFHHGIAMATGNVIYPLLLNSMKPFYTNLSRLFFKDREVIPAVIAFHESIAEAIEKKEAEKAAGIMTEILIHGEHHLKQQITKLKTDTGDRP